MKKFWLYLGIVLLVFLVLAAGGAYWGYLQFKEWDRPVWAAGPKAPPVVYEVPAGATLRSVGEDLERLGLLRQALVFEFWGRYLEQGAKLQAGHYEVSAAMTPRQLLAVLVSGRTVQRKVTFPEGWTLRQCAQAVEKEGIDSAAHFLELTSKKGREFGDIFPANLEGYLLPDTYLLPLKCTGPELARIMTARFRELALPWHTKESPLSLRDTVILASLVEREAQVPEERPLIAGVYINRLRAGMKLECDATVQYALGTPKEYLLYKDLEIDSPYNTYLYPGLPAGPICNPGLDSFKAACQPQASPYFYYVRNDVKGDGSHVFGKDFSEHQNNIRRFQR